MTKLKRWTVPLVAALAIASAFGSCSLVSEAPMAWRTDVRPGNDLDCGSESATRDPACEHITPEVSKQSHYTLHFTEFDDEGWLFPGSGPASASDGYTSAMGRAHEQIDVAIDDLQTKLAKGPVLLVVYVHGWKHSAYVGDSDVQKFREILTDAANADRSKLDANATYRQVVGIYVGWRGSTFPHGEPLSNLTFWARKEAALRVASGSVRELFARIRALRNDWHPDAGRGGTLVEPRLRSLVIGHSFGGQIAFASLAPSILADLALATGDRDAWRSNRLKQTSDLVVLLNPAFEASAYEPVDRLARDFKMPSPYEPPVLVTVTSTADSATGTFFPLGRQLGTLDQRPFVGAVQQEAVLETPGFVDRYRTHVLASTTAPEPAACRGWRAKPDGENLDMRSNRGYQNLVHEMQRHHEWMKEAAAWKRMPDDWSRTLCGRSVIARVPGKHADIVWNVRTDGSLVPGHNEITGDAFTSFLRQVYLDTMYPPGATAPVLGATVRPVDQ